MTRCIPASYADAPRVPLVPRRKHGRHLVVVGTPPADWIPADPADVPDRLTEIETMASGLTLAQAIAETRVFNRNALESGTGTWACILFRAKCGKEVPA